MLPLPLHLILGAVVSAIARKNNSHLAKSNTYNTKNVTHCGEKRENVIEMVVNGNEQFR